jgi:D-erythro-7,8-dihydroneopterin triphosphate epimerase
MKIGFSGLKVKCIIGVFPEERKKAKDLLIDLEVEPISIANEDELELTIDYEKISDLCRQIAKESKFHLLETLARKILDSCFDNFAISAASICINKPKALKGISSAYVKLSKRVSTK